jgi:uncharacterized protein YjbJ (UPF0337 family)
MAGRGKRTKGRFREALGALTDNKEMKDKGRFDQARGSVQKRFARLRDRLR